MIRFASLLVFTTLWFSLMSCSDPKSGDDLSTNVNTDLYLTRLSGGNFILNVNRIVTHPDVKYQHDRLRENDYQKITENSQYKVRFSENSETIIILPDSISGTLEKEDNEFKQYVLEKGLFAGGRFIVWINDNKFEAEFTIYGSGVPIIQSERGYLEPKNF